LFTEIQKLGSKLHRSEKYFSLTQRLVCDTRFQTALAKILLFFHFAEFRFRVSDDLLFIDRLVFV